MAAEKDGKAEGESVETPKPTHTLHLADGQIIDHYGAIPTHHVFKDNKVIRVIAAYEKETE